jgi:hypothetical protein
MLLGIALKVNMADLTIACVIIAAGFILWLFVSPIILAFSVQENGSLTALSWIGFAVCLAGVGLVISGIGNIFEGHAADWLERTWRYLSERIGAQE